MASTAEWIQRAEEAIAFLLDEHHSVVGPELEARIAERYFKNDPGNIDPHHVTTARRNLLRSGHIAEVVGTTRGGRQVKTLQLAGVRLRTTAVNRAAARRRLLHGRYLGWASGTSGSFQPLSPYFGETSIVLGHRLSAILDHPGW